ncbi:hypothetical protein PHLGIDRAFT_34865 [Phlebiopsis gigantea 11061_1 CR5-6]|uniref:Uncharacterized protein n=1 Tax=Phlebiopsis gigantea (strain 11061_1 CR5-6) TaxID=745531 RepID=A0A0C3PP57_PHLG1|nr:hypothetical protein PHLGIDRAFT_34865 [Phlebiopsis gigantea 11061_1 CR5-6]
MFSIEEFESYVNNTYDAHTTVATSSQQVPCYGIHKTLWTDVHGLLRPLQPTHSTQQGIPHHCGRWARKPTPKPEDPTGVPVHRGRWAQPQRQTVARSSVDAGSPALSRSSSFGASTPTAALTPTSPAASLPPLAASTKEARSNEYYAAFYEGPPRLRKLYSRARAEDPLSAIVQAGVERAMAKKGMRAVDQYS